MRLYDPVKREAGFSISELLIVVVIIAVLAVLLMGGISASTNTSRQVRCVSQLKEIGRGLILYAQDNNMRLPPMQSAGGMGWPGWRGIWYSPNPNYSDGSPPQYMGGQEATNRLVVCPERRVSPVPSPPIGITPGGPEPEGYPYVVNYYVMPTSSGQSPPKRLNAFMNPSMTIWLMDGLNNSGWGPGVNIPQHPRIGRAHRNKTHVLWLDQHVSQEDPGTFTLNNFSGS